MSQLGLSPWACRHGSSGVGVAQAWCSSVRLGMLRGMFTLFYVRRAGPTPRWHARRHHWCATGPASPRPPWAWLLRDRTTTSLPRVAYTRIMHGVQPQGGPHTREQQIASRRVLLPDQDSCVSAPDALAWSCWPGNPSPHLSQSCAPMKLEFRSWPPGSA